ncbi:asparagine synthase-related protein [Streptomyces sp. NPDC057702]|uniref:asparagine synthase-related protein n=1 Tax=unclassified Streptomyces TaxID=2593676 RepID=UPI0036A311C2
MSMSAKCPELAGVLRGHASVGAAAVWGADLLPAYVLGRAKQGFPSPLSAWLRGDLGRRLRAEATWAVADGWDVRRENALWVAHRDGRGDWGQQLWRLAVARSWWRGIAAPRGVARAVAREPEGVGDGPG